MRITVQYIPLNRIKSGVPEALSRPVRRLKRIVWDCMHLLAVRKNRKDGTYTLLSGHDRLEYLRQHTSKTHAPCIVDEAPDSLAAKGMRTWLHRLRYRSVYEMFPALDPERLTPPSWRILRRFLREEPRFGRLTPAQKVRVLMVGLRYEKTVADTMRAKIDDLLAK